MDNIGYNKARIFNLFDYKEANSSKAIQFLNEQLDFDISVFSIQRRKELNALTEDDAPYIVAYGLEGLKEYKENVLSFLKKQKDIWIKAK